MIPTPLKALHQWFKSLSKVKLILFIFIQLFHIYEFISVQIDKVAILDTCTEITRFNGAAGYVALIFLVNPTYIRYPPIDIVRKIPDWRSNGYSFFNFYASSILGAYSFTAIRDFADKGTIPDCFSGTIMPWPIILFQVGICMICAVVFTVYMFVMIFRNTYIALKSIFSSEFRNKIGIQGKDKSEQEYILDVMKADKKRARLSKQTFKGLSQYIQIVPIGEKTPYQGYPMEDNEKFHLAGIKNFQALGLKIVDQAQEGFDQRPMYRLNTVIPTKLNDPRTYTLLKELNGLSFTVLDCGAAAAVISYYWEQMRRRFQISQGFNFVQGLTIITYVTTNEKTLEYEVFLLVSIFYHFSFELIALSRNVRIFFSYIDSQISIIEKVLALALINGVWNGNQVFEVSSQNILGPLTIFAGASMILAIEDFYYPIKELILFLDKASRDLVGFAIIFILSIVLISLGYDPILRDIELEDTGENYTLIETLAYVVDQAVGGYTNIPGSPYGTPVQYIALILITVILLNTIIAILSESWVHIKQNAIGIDNKRKLVILMNFLHFNFRKSRPTSGFVRLQWFEDVPEDDPEFYEAFPEGDSNKNEDIAKREDERNLLDMFTSTRPQEQHQQTSSSSHGIPSADSARLVLVEQEIGELKKYMTKILESLGLDIPGK